MIWLWIAFIVFVLIMLVLDLSVFHRHSHVVEVRESLIWTSVWVAMALAFSVFVYYLYEYRLFGIDAGKLSGGKEAAVLFLTAYVVEESLSMDNMFVIAMLFTFFLVPRAFQHRVLFWGILGALVMRGLMIGGGLALVQRFDWILYIFGGFLIYSAVRMLTDTDKPDPNKNFMVRTIRRFLPVSDSYDGEKFTTRVDGRRMLTPLALALLAVESADLVFAVDSIPAVFAITDVPFIVFTSNVFAILGLRSLFFTLSGIMHKFKYLKVSLVVLLMLIGVKMLLKDFIHGIPGLTYWLLGAIMLILAGGIVASIIASRKDDQAKT